MHRYTKRRSSTRLFDDGQGMNFYKRFIGDYQRDTGHLSMTEHGAYTLLLDAYYATGRPLPIEQKTMHRLVRAISGLERAAVAAVLAQFWTKTDDGWVNARANQEIKKAQDFSDAQRAKVKKRY